MSPPRIPHHPTGHPRGGGVPGQVAAAARLVGRLAQALVATGLLTGLVAGLPWALARSVGWPLPTHLPTPVEVGAVLLGPLDAPLLLDVLACLIWVTWVGFVIDVARCALAAARGARWPELHHRGPVHGLAALLVGVIMLSLLGGRTTAAAAGTLGTGPPPAPVVATAPLHPGPLAAPASGWLASPAGTAAPADPGPAQKTDTATGRDVIVREPHDGIHDTLSRIAARALHDTSRWPEIFALNQGQPQPGGRSFTNPNLIFPGQRLTLPDTPPPAHPPPGPGADHQQPPAPPPLPPPAPHPAAVPAPGPPPMSAPPGTGPVTGPVGRPAPSARRGPAQPGIEWEPGVFVSAGLAAAISAALLAARRRNQRAYQPGSGRRDDLPVAPVVYGLRLAHLRATATPNTHGDTDSETDTDSGEDEGPSEGEPDGEGGEDPEPEPALPGPSVGHDPAAPWLGVRDGHEIALNLAAARGLGLAGPGAPAAARALLLTLLSTPDPPPTAAQVIVPAPDLALLLGPAHAGIGHPAGLRVPPDRDTALDELDTQIRHRTRTQAPMRGWPMLVLITRAPTSHTQRLQVVLDNGADLGVVGVLLGQWRPGTSAYVRAEGTVSATSPGPGQALTGTRMFQLPDTEAAQLLALLRHTHPDPLLPDPGRRPCPTPATTATSPARAGQSREQTQHEAREIELELTAIRPTHDPAPGAATGPDTDPRPALPEAGAGQPQHPHNRPEPIPDPQAARITLTVLGSPRVHWTPPSPGATEAGTAREEAAQEITAVFPPRQRELLVYLALHPDGVPRDRLITTLWDTTTQRATQRTNTLNTALSRLRRALHTATRGAVTDIVLAADGRYRLDPHQVDVDYWHFSTAVTARRAATTPGERITANQQIVAHHRGVLAEGLDTDWMQPVREATRREGLDAVAALAHADTNPERTLDLLETARAADPYNELLYRDIMRLQHRLGRLDGIGRTVALLTTRLTEIDEHPSGQTRALATRLHHHAPPPQPPPAATRPRR